MFYFQKIKSVLKCLSLSHILSSLSSLSFFTPHLSFPGRRLLTSLSGANHCNKFCSSFKKADFVFFGCISNGPFWCHLLLVPGQGTRSTRVPLVFSSLSSPGALPPSEGTGTRVLREGAAAVVGLEGTGTSGLGAKRC